MTRANSPHPPLCGRENNLPFLTWRQLEVWDRVRRGYLWRPIHGGWLNGRSHWRNFQEGYEEGFGTPRKKQPENDGTADNPEIVELGEEDTIAEQDGLGGDDSGGTNRVELEEETGGNIQLSSPM